jgi:hypothetical protein
MQRLTELHDRVLHLLRWQMDGSDAFNRDKRDFLFSVSSVRSYPQIFLESDGNAFKYVGTWQYVQELLDNVDIPADVLAQHPDIQTFNTVSALILHYITVVQTCSR